MVDIFKNNSKFKVSEDVMSVEKSGVIRVILFNSDNQYYSIDGMAKVVWTELQKDIGINDITIGISKTNNVDVNELKTFVQKFIDDLISNKLITVQK